MALDKPTQETGYAGWDNGMPPAWSKASAQKIIGPGGVTYYFQPPTRTSPGFVVFPGRGWINNVSSVEQHGAYIHTEAGTGGTGGSLISLGSNNGVFGMSRQYVGTGADRTIRMQMPPTFSGDPAANPYKAPSSRDLAPARTASSTGTGGAGGAGGAGGSGYGYGGGGGGGGGGGQAQYDPNTSVSINTYGYIAKLAKSEPELAKLMAKYAKEDLGNPAVAARLEAEIRDTKWWTSHTDAYRTAEILKATDPATFQKNVNDAIPGVQAAANEYLIPMSDASAKQWATKLASGQITQAQYDSWVREQAKSLFPGMAAAIDSGVTTKQYVQPYADIAAQTLELDPSQVNFLDPKWNKALFQVDPKTGARTSMSLADWQNTLRTDSSYGYDQTQQAKAAGADLVSKMQRTFGAV